MDIEKIREKLYSDFNAEKIVNEKVGPVIASQSISDQIVDKQAPIDLYQRDQGRIREMNSRSFPKGSSAIVNMAVNSVIDGVGAEGLDKAYKRAECDIRALKERGEKGRAEIRRKQYMDEYFLPAVEIVVNSSSPDETLNSTSALKSLDKYVLLDGAGDGYTAAYIRQAYGDQLGKKEGRSDNTVRSGIIKINSMLDDGQIRSAYSLASKLKKQIDNGGAISDDIDYELLSRIISYNS